jgi:hypothetical protein
VIDSEAVREARLALGHQLACARRAAGFNQSDFAPLTAYSRSTIANVETGRQHVGRDFWEHCDIALGTGDQLAGGYDDVESLRRQQHDAAARQAEAERMAVLSHASVDAAREEAATKRRQALGLMGAAFTTLGSALDLEALERMNLGHTHIDRRLVLAHLELAETMASLYRSSDPRVSLPPTMAYADSLLELLDTTMSDAERAELVTVAVGVHAQVGLWACHMHRGSLAYRYLATAAEIAATVDDRPLRARTLGALSYLYSSAPRGGNGGQPRRALVLLDEALDLAEHADTFTQGWLATWRADQHATLGNLVPAHRDVELAMHGLTTSDNSQVTGFFSRQHYGYGMLGHLNSVRGVILALDGQADESARTFDEVQTSAGNMRRRIASYGHEALTHAAHGEAEAACASLVRSLTMATAEHYDMGTRRALGVRRGFAPEWSELPCVQELDEQLRLLSA